jgi:hypothetical protein
MNSSRGEPSLLPVSDLGAVRAELIDLCRPFAPDGANIAADCDVVSPNDIPHPADALLVHHAHMTIALERHYGKPVQVEVHDERLDSETYTRKITLVLSGTEHRVETGIARLRLRHLSSQVRDEILAKQSPLGAILIKHNVHRRIKPRYFLRFPARSATIELLGPGPNAAPVYGRLGTIYCDDEPAIELLEIVINTEVSQTA